MNARGLPKDERQKREWIKYHLRLHGYSLADLGVELGVSRKAVHLALVRSYPRIEQAIAKILGISQKELWPERYSADGRPKSVRRSYYRQVYNDSTT